MLKPLTDKAIVKMKDYQETTKNGILIVGNTEESLKFAQVLEVGIRENKMKIEVKKGDIVVINKNSGEEIKYEGEDLIIINQNEILAVVEE